MELNYPIFRQGVKNELRRGLSAWNLSEEELENYMKQEEQQIQDAFQSCANPWHNDDRPYEVRFKAAISTVVICLEYCY